MTGPQRFILVVAAIATKGTVDAHQYGWASMLALFIIIYALVYHADGVRCN